MTSFTFIEILALIFIVISIIKMVFLFFSPATLMTFTKKMYAKPTLLSGISTVLALIILYQLLESGVRVVDILAIYLFIALWLGIGMAQYCNTYLDWIEKKGLSTLMKEMRLFILTWLLLVGFAIKELFF